MSKPLGGRGKKAAYVTTHMRVPEPIKAEVQSLVSRFHDDYSEDKTTPIASLPVAIVLAKAILMQKKSARVSVKKLLTALYHTEIEL